MPLTQYFKSAWPVDSEAQRCVPFLTMGWRRGSPAARVLLTKYWFSIEGGGLHVRRDPHWDTVHKPRTYARAMPRPLYMYEVTYV
jgi:hypothetical protein